MLLQHLYHWPLPHPGEAEWLWWCDDPRPWGYHEKETISYEEGEGWKAKREANRKESSQAGQERTQEESKESRWKCHRWQDCSWESSRTRTWRKKDQIKEERLHQESCDLQRWQGAHAWGEHAWGEHAWRGGPHHRSEESKNEAFPEGHKQDAKA